MEPAGDPAAAAEPGAALHRKLAWLTFFRLVTMTVLLGGTAVAVWGGDADLVVGATPLFALVLGVFAASLAFALVLKAGRGLRAVAYAQIGVDVTIAAAVVWMTGHAESVFVFLYSLAIVNGSILLFRRGAVAASALSLAVYYPAVLLGSDAASRAPLVLFAHGMAFVATAALAGYLAEQLRHTGERLQAREVDLAAITALHESIVQSVSSGIVTLDAAGLVTFLNRAGEQIMGLAARDALGQPASRWFGAFVDGPGRPEVSLVNARGERLRVGYTVFPLLDAGERRVGTAVIFQDLTRLREMEEAVRRGERLADLGRLAAGLAHELRNPLASMMGSIELIRGSGALPSDDARLLAIVLREAARLDVLVTRFLEFTRPVSPRREPVEVAEVLAETAEVFAHHPDAARVHLERDLARVRVEGDPDQLRQVAWNLLLNAAQAAGADGRSGTVWIACGPARGGGAAVTVRDDGPGIAAADRGRLFTPFFTTRKEGTGLGLATVHRIVDAHGGKLEVDSEPGRGATFRILFPAAPPPAVG